MSLILLAVGHELTIEANYEHTSAQLLIRPNLINAMLSLGVRHCMMREKNLNYTVHLLYICISTAN